MIYSNFVPTKGTKNTASGKVFWPQNIPKMRLRQGHCLGVRTLRHQDTSAPVPKCLGHFGTDHRGIVMLVNGGSYVVDGEGIELKAVDVYVPLSLNCGF